MTEISLSRVADFAVLGERWRNLEARANGSFFQSWTWTGCLAEARFPDPVLLEARHAGQTVALALFNRRRGLRDTVFLGETGDAAMDAVFTEHNGPLLAVSAPPEVAAACLFAARTAPIGGIQPFLPRRLVLSGVGDAVLAAAREAGPVRLRRTRIAPRVDLVRLRKTGLDYLEGLSANTRYQIRRSDRAYAVEGPLELRRAETADEAHAWLDELAALHQATWTRRGAPGAFANPSFGRFHHALIDRGFGRGEIDLLRIVAGGRRIGFLYNFRHAGRALTYQSGFDYAAAGRTQKPGLTCHHRAIRFSAAAGLDCYDFLAGEDRYKVSLSDGRAALHWLEIGLGFDIGALARGAARAAASRGSKRLRGPARTG